MVAIMIDEHMLSRRVPPQVGVDTLFRRNVWPQVVLKQIRFYRLNLSVKALDYSSASDWRFLNR